MCSFGWIKSEILQFPLKNATQKLHNSLKICAIFAAMKIHDPRIVYIEGVPVVYYLQELNNDNGFWYYWSELEPGYVIPSGKTARRRLIAKARSMSHKGQLGRTDNEEDALVKISIEILERQICGID